MEQEAHKVLMQVVDDVNKKSEEIEKCQRRQNDLNLHYNILLNGFSHRMPALSGKIYSNTPSHAYFDYDDYYLVKPPYYNLTQCQMLQHFVRQVPQFNNFRFGYISNNSWRSGNLWCGVEMEPI